MDTKRWQAELVTPEGQQVSVSEWNAVAEKDKPITREEPPLSAAQLKVIAVAPEWRAVVDSIPGNPEGKPGAESEMPPEVDGGAIRKTLVDLLPEGVEVVSQGGQESAYAYVVVDDGKGQSLVQINAQADMSDAAGDLYGDAEKLPDGTLVATSQAPGEKGGAGVVVWSVDTMRTDGFRVVISAFNSDAQHTDATRETPALTIEQLREIALSPKWADLV
ncbi:hypothetical protein [Streptomyces sp. HC307]|uniref:hypothetical protein n=1 Tax=Streptomyces flavusporus TaxID=3385496 RepID=UPI003916EB7B